MSKTRVLVVFGSRSVEHEVSVVTAMQVFENIDREKYEAIPLYIDKKGKWWSGESLKKLESFKDLEMISGGEAKQNRLAGTIGDKLLFPVTGVFKKMIQFDIVMPVVHGTYGEDGTLQGMLEMLDIPYTGCGVTASALGMDKVMQKAVFEKEGIPVVDYTWFTKDEWEDERKEVIVKIEKKLKYPMYVKPVNLGSSVGINVAKDRVGLEWAVEIAKEFDNRIIVEQGLENIDEINCSVMGVDELQCSVCEMPVKATDLLSFQDKYMSGGKTKGMASLSRLIPAPIPAAMTKKIEEYSKKAFRVVGASGVSRIDYLVDVKKEKIWINEINTLPGSLSFYLWEKSGYPFPQFLTKIIELGFEYYKKRKSINFSYESGLLKQVVGGAKGEKNSIHP